MKRAALYLRVSTIDQHPETQLYDLRALAAQRGYQIVREYTDTISGAKSKRLAIHQDRSQGCSLRDIARTHLISTATVRKVLAHPPRACVERVEIGTSGTRINSGPETAA